MGSHQSKQSRSPAQERAMIDRLRKMQLQEYESSVEVNEKDEVGRLAEPLPLDAVALLPKQILEDPKNK